MRISPVQRTLKELRDRGAVVDVVERWITQPKHPGGGFRRDFLNIIDLIACCPFYGITGIQCCAGSGYADHYKKLTIDQVDNTRSWLEAKANLEIWAWRKLKERNKDGKIGKRSVWQPKITKITLQDLIAELPETPL